MSLFQSISSRLSKRVGDKMYIQASKEIISFFWKQVKELEPHKETMPRAIFNLEFPDVKCTITQRGFKYGIACRVHVI